MAPRPRPDTTTSTIATVNFGLTAWYASSLLLLLQPLFLLLVLQLQLAQQAGKSPLA
jgi:hypothetical protein